MKKLKKIKLTKSIEDFIPLKEWELRTIVAGDGEPTWDCLFKSFICYYESMTGITLDQNELVDYYKSCTGRNPCAEGGARYRIIHKFNGSLWHSRFMGRSIWFI